MSCAAPPRQRQRGRLRRLGRPGRQLGHRPAGEPGPRPGLDPARPGRRPAARLRRRRQGPGDRPARRFQRGDRRRRRARSTSGSARIMANMPIAPPAPSPPSPTMSATRASTTSSTTPATFVRKSPGIAIGIAAVAGFALMRVIKTGLDDVRGGTRRRIAAGQRRGLILGRAGRGPAARNRSATCSAGWSTTAAPMPRPRSTSTARSRCTAPRRARAGLIALVAGAVLLLVLADRADPRPGARPRRPDRAAARRPRRRRPAGAGRLSR